MGWGSIGKVLWKGAKTAGKFAIKHPDEAIGVIDGVKKATKHKKDTSHEQIDVPRSALIDALGGADKSENATDLKLLKFKIDKLESDNEAIRNAVANAMGQLTAKQDEIDSLKTSLDETLLIIQKLKTDNAYLKHKLKNCKALAVTALVIGILSIIASVLALVLKLYI